jgi:hypothetical protein
MGTVEDEEGGRYPVGRLDRRPILVPPWPRERRNLSKMVIK